MKILLIDADVESRLALRALLEAATYTVVSADDEDEGLRRIGRDQPDLIVLGTSWHASAWRTLERLRHVSDVPALVLLPGVADAAGATGQLGGCDDYVVAPFDDDELLARIAVLARKPGVDLQRRDEVTRVIAKVLESEGHNERALAAYVDANDHEAVQRLLPTVIMDVVGRGDVELAVRYLDAQPLAAQPAPIVLARLAIASIQQSLVTGLGVIDEVERDGRLEALIIEDPRIGAFACNFLASAGSLTRALSLLDSIPPGRAADTARLLLSAARDDPDAPLPSLTGDVLDGIVARGLYHRGRLRVIRETGKGTVRYTSGVPDLLGEHDEPLPTLAPLGQLLAGVTATIDARDLEGARAIVGAIDARPAPIYAALSEAEVAVHLERDPQRALAAVERARALPVGRLAYFDEVSRVWEGAALLSLEATEAAADTLRAAISSMRRGDRTLVLASALVYLAEAEWRLGDEGAADASIDEALAVAREQGNMRALLRSLADFPGVLSRRLDAEPAADAMWHTVGRALIQTSAGSVSQMTVSAHLREFGDPALVTEKGEMLRPKIRKSLELLSYLLSRPQASASRSEVLTALWAGRDDDSARAYLRQALRQLRNSLAPTVSVVAEGDVLSAAGAVTSDSNELDALVSAAALETDERRVDLLLDAIEITRRGLFLDGSRDVPWVDDRRGYYASLAADMRLDVAARLLETDQHLEALALVDEALAADPLLERGWRLRMTALGLLGDLDGVTLSYRQCRSALGEIGLEPSRATIELAGTLRR